MSEAPARSLAQWRTRVVEGEKTAQAAALSGLTRARELVADAVRTLDGALQARFLARDRHLAARTPADLVWVERRARTLSLHVRRAEMQLRLAETARTHAQARMDAITERLREAELERRAVSRLIERRSDSRVHAAELLAEEEAADVHRVRRT